jgi:putative SOS response-associated peptidase YedK
MCNEYTVQWNGTNWVWVYHSIGGGKRDVGDYDPADPEIVKFTRRYNAFPDTIAPVARLGADGGLIVEEMRWGFPPPKDGMPVVTNVRNLGSAFWRQWLRPEWRCLVPVSDFCEWTDVPNPVTGKKSKKWFRLKCDTPFMFAGIWRTWKGVRGTKKNPIEGEHKVFAFITTEPNEIVGAIHSKAMPVILQRGQWRDWLTAPVDIAKEMVKPSDADEMEQPADAPVT